MSEFQDEKEESEALNAALFMVILDIEMDSNPTESDFTVIVDELTNYARQAPPDINVDVNTLSLVSRILDYVLCPKMGKDNRLGSIGFCAKIDPIYTERVKEYFDLKFKKGMRYMSSLGGVNFELVFTGCGEDVCAEIIAGMRKFTSVETRNSRKP